MTRVIKLDYGIAHKLAKLPQKKKILGITSRFVIILQQAYQHTPSENKSFGLKKSDDN